MKFQDAKADLEILAADEIELEELRRELATYYCEDETIFKLDACISVFNTFCQRFFKADEVSDKNIIFIAIHSISIKHNFYFGQTFNHNAAFSCIFIFKPSE